MPRGQRLAPTAACRLHVESIDPLQLPAAVRLLGRPADALTVVTSERDLRHGERSRGGDHRRENRTERRVPIIAIRARRAGAGASQAPAVRRAVERADSQDVGESPKRLYYRGLPTCRACSIRSWARSIRAAFADVHARRRHVPRPSGSHGAGISRIPSRLRRRGAQSPATVCAAARCCASPRMRRASAVCSAGRASALHGRAREARAEAACRARPFRARRSAFASITANAGGRATPSETTAPPPSARAALSFSRTFRATMSAYGVRPGHSHPRDLVVQMLVPPCCTRPAV